MIRLLALLASLCLAFVPAAQASQATLVTPGSPLPMSSLASFLNAALLSIGSQNSGSSAPTNGTGGAAFAGESWCNTSSSTWVCSLYDGSNWVQWGSLNSSTHTWVTPLTVGGSSVGSGTSPYCLNDNSGTLGNVNCARLDLADQTASGGVNVASDNLGTVSSGTLTIDCGARPLQYVTNGGAFSLHAPSNDGSCMLLITNGAGAGAITTAGQGFTVGSSTGAPFDTTNGHMFTVSIWRINGVAGYSVFAHQ